MAPSKRIVVFFSVLFWWRNQVCKPGLQTDIYAGPYADRNLPSGADCLGLVCELTEVISPKWANQVSGSNLSEQHAVVPRSSWIGWIVSRSNMRSIQFVDLQSNARPLPKGGGLCPTSCSSRGSNAPFATEYCCISQPVRSMMDGTELRLFFCNFQNIA